jgi:hypothetical protein
MVRFGYLRDSRGLNESVLIGTWLKHDVGGPRWQGYSVNEKARNRYSGEIPMTPAYRFLIALRSVRLEPDSSVMG